MTDSRRAPSFEEKWRTFFTEPISRPQAIARIGAITGGIVVARELPERIEGVIAAIESGVQNVEGLISLLKITRMPPFYHDARHDKARIPDVFAYRQIFNLGNSFSRGHIDFKAGQDPAKIAAAINAENGTTVFKDRINPPGRLLIVRHNQGAAVPRWDHWQQDDDAVNGGKIIDVDKQIWGLRREGKLQTPVPKMLIIGAGDNDTFLTPDIQTHFASLESNIYQEETLRIAHQLDIGITNTGGEFVDYLTGLDHMNRKEGWNVTDIFLLGSPYLTYAEGVVIKLGPTDYQVMSLAKDGLARRLLDNVSDTINTMKGEVITRYRTSQPSSSYNLHLLSARLPQEIVGGIVVPSQLFQHDTFRGYNRETARLANMIEDDQGVNLGDLYFNDYPLERDLRRT